MHDPLTVVADIKWPWYWLRYRTTFITIWHIDPETDGSDDSCGWSYPKLTKQQRSRLEHLAYNEKETPWFLKVREKRIQSPADAESLMRGAVQAVATALELQFTWEEICKIACRLAHNPQDNFQSSLCHLPGYHTNFEEDLKSEREQSAQGFFNSIGKILLRDKRPWYKQPKWHIWHWQIQVHPLQHVKRWLFSRCERCGCRFKYGESPCSGSWNGTGPLWFKSEQHVHHGSCLTRSCSDAQAVIQPHTLDVE